MLEHFGDGIWTAIGPAVSVAGFRFPTRMAVVRLGDGGLFVWSPIALTDDLRAAVDRLGPVRHLVAPNTLHHLSIGEWHAAYPGAIVHAPAALRARRPGLPPGRDLGDTPAAEWADDVDQVVVRGNRITTETVFFHRPSRTVIVADLIQQFDREWFTGWRALVARIDLLTAPAPTVPRKFRLAFRDRNVAREAVRRILAWPAERVLMAHAPPVHAEGRAIVADAFRWLLR